MKPCTCFETKKDISDANVLNGNVSIVPIACKYTVLLLKLHTTEDFELEALH